MTDIVEILGRIVSRILDILKKVFQVIIVLGLQILGILILRLFIIVGHIDPWEGWSLSITIPPALSIIAYHIIKIKKGILKIIYTSLINLVLVYGEIYFYIAVLKFDAGFGAMIIILTSIFAPINYWIISLLIKLIKKTNQNHQNPDSKGSAER